MGETAAAQLTVGDGQAVLIGMARHLPTEALGGREGQRTGTDAPRAAPFQDPRLAEIRNLRPAAEEEDVLRLEVTMLEADSMPSLELMPFAVEIINRGGRVGQVTEQLLAGNPPQALRSRFQEAVAKRAIGQLH